MGKATKAAPALVAVLLVAGCASGPHLEDSLLPGPVRAIVGEDCAGELESARAAAVEARRTCAVDVRDGLPVVRDKAGAVIGQAREQLEALRELLQR